MLIEERVAQLWEYMLERQRIYHRRLEGRPWPWTLDPVLRDYRFPNVYRQLDKGTIYLRNELLPKLEPGQIFLNMVAYRHFNTIYAAERLLPLTGSLPGNIHLYLEGVDPYTQSYRTSPFTNLGGLTQLENSQIASYTWAEQCPKWERHLDTMNMKDAMLALANLPGIGPFVGYVIACDLTYTHLVNYDENSDVYPGTGSIAALRWLWTPGTQFTELTARAAIFHLWKICTSELTLREFPFLLDGGGNPVPLTVRGIEDGLCELMRYRKLKYADGVGRRYYRTRELPV